jgi:hypothetical protein
MTKRTDAKKAVKAGKSSGSSSKSKSAKDALYEKIGEFFREHPEAVDMNLEDSDRLFEDWLKNGKS